MQITYSGTRSRLSRQISISIALLTAAFALQWLLRNRIGENVPFAVLISAIALVAVSFGAVAGMAATGGSALAAALLMLPPVYSLRVASAGDRWQLLFFLVEGIALTSVCAAYRVSLRRNNEALVRERLASAEVRQSAQSASQAHSYHQHEWLRISGSLAAGLRPIDPGLAADLEEFVSPLPEINSSSVCQPGSLIDEVVAHLRSGPCCGVRISRTDLPLLRADPAFLSALFRLLLELPALAESCVEISLGGKLPGAAAIAITVDRSLPTGARELLRLARSRRIIEALQGRVWNDSLLSSGGLAFVFSIPSGSGTPEF